MSDNKTTDVPPRVPVSPPPAATRSPAPMADERVVHEYEPAVQRALGKREEGR